MTPGLVLGYVAVAALFVIAVVAVVSVGREDLARFRAAVDRDLRSHRSSSGERASEAREEHGASHRARVDPGRQGRPGRQRMPAGPPDGSGLG